MSKNRELAYVLILAAIQFSHILDFVVLMPLGPSLMRALGITPIEFAQVVSSYSFSAATTAIIYGIFADRYDRKLFMMICLTLFIVGTAMCGMATSFHTLMIARIVAGAFGGILNSIVFAMVSDLIPFERRGRALGIIMSAFSIASVLGVPAGLIIAEAFDWHTTFFAIAALAGVVWIVTLKLIPSLKDHIEEVNIVATLKRFKKVLLTTDYLKAFGLIFILNIAAFSIIPFLSPYAVKNVGLLESELKYIYLSGGAFTIISARIIGNFTDKLGTLKVFIFVSILACVPIYLYTNAGPLPLGIFLIYSTAFMMCVSGRFIPCMTMVTAIPSNKDRGTFMGLLNSVQGLGSATAAIVGGMIISEDATGKLLHFNILGYMAIVLTLVTIALATYLYNNVAKGKIHADTSAMA